MSITGTQTSIYNGLTFGPYLKKSVDESRSDTTERSFQNLLRQGSQDKQDLTGEGAESTVQAEVEEAKKLLKNYQTVLVKALQVLQRCLRRQNPGRNGKPNRQSKSHLEQRPVQKADKRPASLFKRKLQYNRHIKRRLLRNSHGAGRYAGSFPRRSRKIPAA